MGRQKKVTRGIVYPTLDTRIFDDDNPITVDQAMDWLGWTTENMFIHEMMQKHPDTKESKWEWKSSSDYDFVDKSGDKVKCLNNSGNRDLQVSWATEIAYDILNGNWRLNGESIILGKTGKVLSAQHRLIGLIFASQMWAKQHPNHHWKQVWKEAPYLTSFVSFGIDETADTVRTIDNVRKRTLADVLFTNERSFAGKSRKDRVQLTKIVDYAVKFLWSRTGKDRKAYNAFAPRRTHSEAVEFIENHPHLLEYADYIHGRYKQNWAKFVREVIHPGYATGLLYMMATSNTDGERYRAADPPREGTAKKPVVDFANEKMALKFWDELITETGGKELAGLRATLKDPLFGGKRDEQLTILNMGWDCWLQEEEIPDVGFDIRDRYLQDSETSEVFLAKPALANGEGGLGIDLGPPEDPRLKSKKEKPVEGDGEIGGIEDGLLLEESEEEMPGKDDEPSPEEIEAMAAEVNGKAKTPKKSKPRATKASKPAKKAKKGKGHDEEEGETPLVPEEVEEVV